MRNFTFDRLDGKLQPAPTNKTEPKTAHAAIFTETPTCLQMSGEVVRLDRKFVAYHGTDGRVLIGRPVARV